MLRKFACVERGWNKTGYSFFTGESPQHPLPSHPMKATADGGKAKGKSLQAFFEAVLHAAATRG